MSFEYTTRWDQVSKDFRSPGVVEILETRDRELELHLDSVGPCTAYFFYKYRWDQIHPLIWSDPDRATILLEEHYRELEEHLNRSTGTNCKAEYTYRWPQIIDMLRVGDPRAFTCLESNDQALEQMIANCSCGCNTGLRFFLSSPSYTFAEQIQIWYSDRTFSWPSFTLDAAAGDGFIDGLKAGSEITIDINTVDAGLYTYTWTLPYDAPYSTSGVLLPSAPTSPPDYIQSGDSIQLTVNPYPFVSDTSWTNFEFELTFPEGGPCVDIDFAQVS